MVRGVSTLSGSKFITRRSGREVSSGTPCSWGRAAPCTPNQLAMEMRPLNKKSATRLHLAPLYLLTPTRCAWVDLSGVGVENIVSDVCALNLLKKRLSLFRVGPVDRHRYFSETGVSCPALLHRTTVFHSAWRGTFTGPQCQQGTVEREPSNHTSHASNLARRKRRCNKGRVRRRNPRAGLPSQCLLRSRSTVHVCHYWHPGLCSRYSH